MQKEITQDFYPHRRDDDSYANLLPDNNPTYPTMAELSGLLGSVQALTNEASGHAEAAGESAQAAEKSEENAERSEKSASKTLEQINTVKQDFDQRVTETNQKIDDVSAEIQHVGELAEAAQNDRAWANYYMLLAKAYIEGASSTPAPPGGVSMMVVVTGARSYYEATMNHARVTSQAAERVQQQVIFVNDSVKNAEAYAERAETALESLNDQVDEAEEAHKWAEYYSEVARVYAYGGDMPKRPDNPGGVTSYAPMTGVNTYADMAIESARLAAEESGKAITAAEAATEAVASAEQTLAAVGIAPAIVIDVEAALEASRELIGTDGEMLLAMMEDF